MAEPSLMRITPSVLRGAATMCARRLAHEIDSEADRSADPVNRSRLRDAFLAAAQEAHAELRVPTLAAFGGAGANLEPEERTILDQAAHLYVAIFGQRPARWHAHGLARPSPSAAPQARIGGWVDLALVGADGTKELRQIDLWGSKGPVVDPLELDAVRIVVLRLSRWTGDELLAVSWADLVRGRLVERVVTADELPGHRAWFDERLARLRERAALGTATAGADCGTCRFVAACPEHPNGAHGSRRSRHDLRPGIITLTPTALASWHRCPREWRNSSLLALPRSDSEGSGAYGIRMHDLLRFVHERGSCHDPTHVDDVLAADGLDADARVHDELVRHGERCPSPAESLGHEVTRARFHRLPLPLFMGTARIDALWEHDGLLDARDYKTGRPWVERVGDDPRARLQAWVLAPEAARRGLQIRVQYEHLSSEVTNDPDPFEPDTDVLDAIDEELRAVVDAMHRSDLIGVSDEDTCRRCGYRSICPDSTVTAVPEWPLAEPEAEGDTFDDA